MKETPPPPPSPIPFVPQSILPPPRFVLKISHASASAPRMYAVKDDEEVLSSAGTGSAREVRGAAAHPAGGKGSSLNLSVLPAGLHLAIDEVAEELRRTMNSGRVTRDSSGRLCYSKAYVDERLAQERKLPSQGLVSNPAFIEFLASIQDDLEEAKALLHKRVNEDGVVPLPDDYFLRLALSQACSNARRPSLVDEDDFVVLDDIPTETMVQYDKDDPPMEKGSAFPTMEEFRMALKTHDIKNQFEVKTEKTEAIRFRGHCTRHGCLWAIVARLMNSGKFVMVTVNKHAHTCASMGRIKTRMVG